VGEPALDPEELLRRLRAEHRVLTWEPLPPDQPASFAERDWPATAGPLGYVHGHWELPNTFDTGAVEGGARRGIKHRMVSLFGRLTFRALGGYLREERELLAQMVQLQDALTRRCDELAFRCAQLDQKIVDRQVAESADFARLAVWLDLLSSRVEPDTGATPT
jgi:hypothetical protein